jgi:hypothetical protein
MRFDLDKSDGGAPQQRFLPPGIRQAETIGILPAQLADESVPGVELNFKSFPILDPLLQATHTRDPGIQVDHSSSTGERKDTVGRHNGFSIKDPRQSTLHPYSFNPGHHFTSFSLANKYYEK